MTHKQALRILRQFQEWRRYDGPTNEDLADCGLLSSFKEKVSLPVQPQPKAIGKALDVAIKVLAAGTEK